MPFKAYDTIESFAEDVMSYCQRQQALPFDVAETQLKDVLRCDNSAADIVDLSKMMSGLFARPLVAKPGTSETVLYFYQAHNRDALCVFAHIAPCGITDLSSVFSTHATKNKIVVAADRIFRRWRSPNDFTRLRRLPTRSISSSSPPI